MVSTTGPMYEMQVSRFVIKRAMPKTRVRNKTQGGNQ